MKNFFQFSKKIFNGISGSIFGLLSVLFSLTGILISFFSFPGFNILYFDVSYLAVGPMGIIFNLSLIFSGITAIPFNVYMNKIIKFEGINLKLRKFALVLSLISSIALSLIGLFPVLTDNIIVLLIHGILALITFLGVTVYCILYGIFFIENSKFTLAHVFLSFLVSGIFIFYFTNRWSIVEWIGVYSIMIWITFNAIFALLKKY